MPSITTIYPATGGSDAPSFSPAAGVRSVNGKSGNVTLVLNDVASAADVTDAVGDGIASDPVAQAAIAGAVFDDITGNAGFSAAVVNGVEAGIAADAGAQQAVADAIVDKLPFALDAAGAVGRPLVDKISDLSFSVKDYGAKGDYDPVARTGTDDSAALCAAWEAVKAAAAVVGSSTTAAFMVNVTLTIPPGFYRVDSPINWTNTRVGVNIHVIAHGAVICGRCVDKPVIDAIGSRWVHIHGLTIFGDATDMPRCGIQIGRYNASAIGNNGLYSVTTHGHFRLAGLYNVASETTRFDHCRFNNSCEDADSFAVICDGNNYWGVASDYVTVTIPTVDNLSFTNNFFASCEFRQWGGGDDIWLSTTRGFTFDRGCYFLAWSGANVRLWLTSTSLHRDLDISGHFETSHDDVPAGSGNTGVVTTFLIEGDGTNAQLDGFKVRTHGPHCSGQFVGLSNTGNIGLAHVDWHVTLLGESTAKFFGNASTLAVVGKISTQDTAKLNLNEISRFVGDVHVSDLSGFTPPLSGAFKARGTQNSYELLDGARLLSGDSWVTATESGGVLTVGGLLNVLTATGGQVITSLSWTALKANGLPFIIVRNASGSNSFTIQHNGTTIRTLTGSNVVVPARSAVVFVAVSDTDVQQIAGAV